jgi:type II secretory pathway predicted ATPase ExeA
VQSPHEPPGNEAALADSQQSTYGGEERASIEGCPGDLGVKFCARAVDVKDRVGFRALPCRHGEALHMIEAHFGLRRRPFPVSPDHACYYPATSHEQALARLLDGLTDGEGLLVLAGAPGLGKTLLGHCLLDRLGVRPGEGEQVEAVFLAGTHARDRVGLLQAILYDLSLPHEGRSEQEMRLALVDHLLGQYAAGRRTVLLVDEAQLLSVEQLEELRTLGNLEGRGGKALQVVLLGQPGLLETLARPECASLRQRVAVRAALAPLEVEEAADYLLHHLRAAGGRAEQILGAEALELLARSTQGVPRLLNQVAHQALRLSAQAGSAEVEVEAVLEALALLELASPVEPGPAEPGEPLLLAAGRTA